MSHIKDGDKVKVHYTVRLEDGKVVFNSKEGEPAEFQIGGEDFHPRIEKGIIGMEIGETKTFEIPPEEAFGVRKEDLVMNIKTSDLPQDITPVVGQQLKLTLPDGNKIDVTVLEMHEDNITLDANHPLAGETLFFDIESIEIV
jgi:peptidylprolyl isomerase